MDVVKVSNAVTWLLCLASSFVAGLVLPIEDKVSEFHIWRPSPEDDTNFVVWDGINLHINLENR